jgi:hypothetical protein
MIKNAFIEIFEMADNTSDWVKIPPRDKDESPEEIRRQRDLYRDILDAQLLKEWQDVKLEDWSLPDGGRAEIQTIIDEVQASLRDG